MRSRQTVEINGKTVTEEDMWPWLSTAFEGGSNYWIGKVTISNDTRKLHSLFANEFSNTVTSWRWYHQVPFVLAGNSSYKGHELEIDSPDGKYYLTIHKIIEGLYRMSQESPRHYQDLVDGNYDAITADVFLQYALFDKVIFG